METFLTRYKNPLVLALVLVALFFLLAVQVRRPFPAAAARVDQEGVRALRFGVATVVTPPESALHRGGLSLRGIWSGYLDLIHVRAENEQLKAEIDRLRLEQAALAEDARQGERLQDLLAFRQNYINATVPAQVVGTSGTDRSRVIYLDKGSDDGIATDMPVITPDGIVGRVREVFPHSAQVLEISDPSSASGVLLEQTRTRGILRGSASGQPEIVNLMPDDRIKPGQTVLTSGGDGIFPRGLPVGVVDRIQPDRDNEPMVDVLLKPAASLGRLEEVLVVTGTGPVPAESARHDVAKSELMAAGERAAQEEAAAAASMADAQRASDVLAQRLPSRYDQSTFYAPDATADSSPATTEAEAKPLHPPSALHPDHYTPGDIPPAASLKPGARYAPLVEGTAAMEKRPARPNGAGINTTDTAPVGTNPAFSAAVTAMNAERKAAGDARSAELARRYAATHPAAPVPPAIANNPNANNPNKDGAAPKEPARVNADGSVTHLPASGPGSGSGQPAASAVPAPVRYINRTNADGTVTRVAVPAPKPGVEYIKQHDADGAVKWVPVAPGTGVVYVNRNNADGTVTRVAVPSAGGAPGQVHYMARVNADGTIAHVPIVPGAANAAVHSVTRTNTDGTVTHVAAPAASGTPTAKPKTQTPATPSTIQGASAVKTHVVADGPLTAASAANHPANPSKPRPKPSGPALVPDDGSRPPTESRPKPAPNRSPQATQSTSAPQVQQEQQ